MVTDVLAGAPLHPTVVTAFRAAGARVAPHPVDTRDLLVALMRADASGKWSRVWLHTGDIDAIASAVVLDPATGSSAAWETIPVTDTCAVALDIGGRLASRYNLWPLPVGLVALGLVADDSSAAAQALCAGVTHAELLRLLQSEIVGMPLSGIEAILPTVEARAREAHRSGHPASSPVRTVASQRRPRWLAPLVIGLCVLAYGGLWAFSLLIDRGSGPTSAVAATTTTTTTAVSLQVGTAAPSGPLLDIHVPPGTELPGAQWPDACILLSDPELRAILPQATGFTRRPLPADLFGFTNGRMDMHKDHVPRAGCGLGFRLPSPYGPNPAERNIDSYVKVWVLGIVDPNLIGELYDSGRDHERVTTDVGNAWGADACYTWHDQGGLMGDNTVNCRKGQYYFQVELHYYLSDFPGGIQNFGRILPEVVQTVSSKMN